MMYVYYVIDETTGGVVYGQRGSALFDNRSGCSKSVSVRHIYSARYFAFLTMVYGRQQAIIAFKDHEKSPLTLVRDVIEPLRRQHPDLWEKAKKMPCIGDHSQFTMYRQEVMTGEGEKVV